MYKYYSGHAEEGSADEVDFKTKPLLQLYSLNTLYYFIYLLY
jgi:hypothetical protein